MSFVAIEKLVLWVKGGYDFIAMDTFNMCKPCYESVSPVKSEAKPRRKGITMPIAGAKYRQKATYKLNKGEIGKDAPISLTHKIQPFERIVTVQQATNEEFAEFVWQVLQQLYTKEKHMMNVFDDLFDVDWTSPIARAGALVNLININKSRTKEKRIRLFVE